MRLWSFIRSLFRRPPPTRPVAELDAQPEPTPAPAAASEETLQPHVEAEPEPLSPPSAEEEDDEDLWEADDDDDEDASGEPDPFIHGPAPDFDFKAAEVGAMRVAARAEALSGEHRLPLSTPAGPGSLAEALNILLEEGLVEAEFVEDPLNGPFMLYRPLTPDA